MDEGGTFTTLEQLRHLLVSVNKSALMQEVHNSSPSPDSRLSFRLSLIFATSIECCLTYVPPSSPVQKVILIGACVAVSLLVLVVCLMVGLN